jgi:hypothetical protein
VPTARELLEQADALMRRNRAGADDDIPVLTDAVPSVQEAPARVAPVLRPVEPPAELPAAIPAGGDDVPVLTEEIEEIEAAAVVAAVDEGEPSVWLDFQESEPSVIGAAPDSIAMVPPVDPRSPPPLSEIAEVDELDALDDELAAAVAAAPREEESLQPSATAQPVTDLPMAMPAEVWPPAPAVIAGGAAALLHKVASALPVATAPVVMAPVEVAAVPLATPQAVPDAAHWEAMAEEIRMQVLQRIDLFTDTGLRAQLGARLQPIVDRASADLVATINQHVGELLRAYVAEAIEREIDSWRKDH